MLSISYRVTWKENSDDPIHLYVIFNDKMDALRKCIELCRAGYSVHLCRCIYNTATCTPTASIIWQSKKA